MNELVNGNDLSFTLTATPAPESSLEVTMRWSDPGSFLAERGMRTVTIPTSGRVMLRTVTDFGADEPKVLV